MSELTQPRPGFTEPEKEMLSQFLDYHRAVFLHKLENLSDAQLRSRPIPSTAITLLGLTKHLALSERDWFEIIFDSDTNVPPWSEEDPDADWRVEPHETSEQIIELYKSQIEKSRQIVAAHNLDDLAKSDLVKGKRSLRWVMLHLIEEAARHNGHADLIRESIDGVTGD